MRLRTNDVSSFQFWIKLRGMEGETHVNLERHSPKGCRDCHISHSSANYQYGIGLAKDEREKYAGPCEFTPVYKKYFPEVLSAENADVCSQTSLIE